MTASTSMAVRLKEPGQVKVKVEENKLCGFEMVSHGVKTPLEALMSDENRSKNTENLKQLAVLRLKSEKKLTEIISNDKEEIPSDIPKEAISIKILSTDFYNGSVTFSLNGQKPRIYFFNANEVQEFQQIYTIIEQLGFSCGESGSFHKYESSSKGPVDLKCPSFSCHRESFSKSKLSFGWEEATKCLTESSAFSKGRFKKFEGIDYKASAIETEKTKAKRRLNISKKIHEHFIKNLEEKKSQAEKELEKSQEPIILSKLEALNKAISQVKNINVFSIAFTAVFPFEVEEPNIENVPQKMLDQANERRTVLEEIVGNEFPEVVTDIAAMGIHEPIVNGQSTAHFGMVRDIYQKFCEKYKVLYKTDSVEEGIYLTARRLDHSKIDDSNDLSSISFFRISGIPSGIVRLSEHAEVMGAYTEAVMKVNTEYYPHEAAE